VSAYDKRLGALRRGNPGIGRSKGEPAAPGRVEAPERAAGGVGPGTQGSPGEGANCPAVAPGNDDDTFMDRSKETTMSLRMLMALVRSEKTCVSEGESPSSLEARLPEFGTKVKNGKV